MRRLFCLVTLVLTLIAAGCGGEEVGDVVGATSACRGKAVAETGLPANFPGPAGVVYTSSREAGPTLVVEGYVESSIPDAYEDLKRAVDAARYTVLFMEQEEHDAEIAYEASDTSGLIALRDDCTEDDTLRVRVTNRPK